MISTTNLVDILQSFDQGYLLVDNRGFVVGMGARTSSLLGLSEKEAAGKHVSQLIRASGFETALFEGPDSVLERCVESGADWMSPLSGIAVDGADDVIYLNIQIRSMTWGGALILIADAGPVREVLESNDALLSVTSHELKTPLTAIKATAELLLAYEVDSIQRNEMLGDIYKQAERLELLIREILDASQLDSGRMPLEPYEVDLRGTLAARDADYDLAVEQYNQTLSDALREVVDQLTSLRSVETQRGEVETALAAAEEAYSLAVTRYKAGIGSLLQVFTAEMQVLEQRTLRTELLSRELTLSIGLIRALGGGFDVQVAMQ